MSLLGGLPASLPTLLGSDTGFQCPRIAIGGLRQPQMIAFDLSA